MMRDEVALRQIREGIILGILAAKEFFDRADDTALVIPAKSDRTVLRAINTVSLVGLMKVNHAFF